MNAIATLVTRRARLVLVLAAVLTVVAAVAGFTAFGVLQSGGQDDPHSESARASTVADRAFGGDTNLVLLVDAKRAGGIHDAAAVRQGQRIATALAHDGHVANLHSFTDAGRAGSTLVSSNGRYGAVVLHVNDPDQESRAGDITDRFAGDTASGDGGDVTVSAGGDLAFSNDVGPEIGKSLGLAEAVAVPIVLVLLLIVFGSFVAAMLPLAIGIIAVFATFAELAVLGRVTDVSIYSINLTTALGLGLGIDYALLTVARFRERLAAGDDVPDAVRHTVRTAGRTIVFSATTVAIALAALLIFPLYFLRSFAYAGIGVVVLAAIAAVVVCPALLMVLGHRIDAGRMPWARRRALVPDPERSRWGRLARFVMRRPALTALPVLAVLIVSAIPLFGVTFGTPDDRVLRNTVAVRQVGDVMRGEFAASPSGTLDVLVQGRATRAELTSYAAKLRTLPDVASVATTGRTDADGGVARLTVTSRSEPTSSAAQDLVRAVRAGAEPAGTSVLVGGQTAVLIDSTHAVSSRLWIAIALIALTTMAVLFAFTGSLLQPLRALVSSALSLAATLGILVLVFQHGWGASVLDVTPHAMDTAMSVLMFCIVFGLSIDYEVFVTSRVKEMHDAGVSTQESVARGLAHTGRLLTAAAVLLAISFFGFVLSTVSFLQMFGLGAGLAVLIDAFLVRGVLLPAFMRVAGEAAWWVPRRLAGVRRRLATSEN